MGWRNPNDSAHEPAKAKREGIMLSGEDFILRRAASIKTSDAREVITHVPRESFILLIERARRGRMTPGALASEMLIDAIADGQVSHARKTGTAGAADEDLLLELAEARAEARRLEGEVERLKGKTEARANAAAIDALKAKVADISTERDKALAVLEAVRKQCQEETALRVGAIERMKKAESERDQAWALAESERQNVEAALIDIETMKSRNDQLLTEIAACARPLPPIITIHAEAPVKPETRAALTSMAEAAVDHLRSTRAPEVSDATRRLILGLAAAGNSAHAIARDTLIAKPIVEAVLAQAKGGV